MIVTPDIVVETTPGVTEIRIDRPGRKNAITSAMYGAMAEALTRAENDDTLVVIISGAGAAFTSGNDLHDFLADPPGGEDRPVARFMDALSTSSKIVIAAVDGPAVGIGTTLLLHCDLVVAGPDARFSMPFVDLALVPEFASSMLLPRLIGRRLAAKHLILAEPFDAATALRYGLVSEVATSGQTLTLARDMARRITAKAPDAVLASKRLLSLPDQSVPARIAEENEAFGRQLRSPEAKEAMTAILEKRAPRFAPRPSPAQA